MKRASILLAAAGLALCVGGAASAATVTTLDFSGNICGVDNNEACGNGSGIGQNYGDSIGVNVSSGTFTADNSLVNVIGHWSTGYGNLENVAYGSSGAGLAARFIFAPNAGFEVRLLDFAMGCFGNRASCATFDYLVSAGGSTLASAAGVSTNFPAGAAVSLNTAWVTDPLTLQWGSDLFNLGIDNIRFEWRAIDSGGGGGGGVPGVPEPASWAMLIAGFGLVGAASRRRRRSAAA